MNFIIVTLNTAGIQLLKAIQDKHNIQIVQSSDEALIVLDQLVKQRAITKDYYLLTEFKIPQTKGHQPDPMNAINLATVAANYHFNVIVGLAPQECHHHQKMKILSEAFAKKQPNTWYLTKQTLELPRNPSATIYFVKLSTTSQGVNETLLRPLAYDWPKVIELVEKNLPERENRKDQN